MPSLRGGRDAEQIVALKPRLSSYLEEFGECFVSFDLLHARLRSRCWSRTTTTKLMRCPRRHLRQVRHRLDALARQIAELALHMTFPMPARVANAARRPEAQVRVR
jgi:hypothetical protein